MRDWRPLPTQCPLTRASNSMGRRAALVSGALALSPVVARSQQPKALVRIGELTAGSIGAHAGGPFVEALRNGLRELGYAEGRNLYLDSRDANGAPEILSRFARELVRQQPDVLVAMDTPAAQAFQRETSTIPIVVTVMGDPVGDGLVVSLARPGGNITGLSFIGPQLVPKRLALLQEVLPGSSLAAIWHPTAYREDTMRSMVDETKAAALSMSVDLKLYAASDPSELAKVLVNIAADGTDAVFVFPSPLLFSERKPIVDFALAQRLPLMSMGREFVELGGLLSYGVSISALNRRSATLVDKILRGAKPAELPVEQPTKLELAINLGTAQKLGIQIPTSLLASADALIE